MKTKLLSICICFIWVNYAHTKGFSSILNTEVECGDPMSIVMLDINKTWIVKDCTEPLPLNAAVDSDQITQFTPEHNKIKRLKTNLFHSLPAIKHLMFFENPVRRMDGNALEELKYLINLTIIEPHLATDVLHLSRECKLEHLNLHLQIFNSELLTNLPKRIMNIAIEDIPVVNGVISIADHLINLKYLRFKNCSIVTVNGPNVALSALEYLDLSHNKIEEKTWT